MELFVGVTLDEFLKENGGRIDGESAVAIALSVGGALKDIHKAGYIHRDVAPDNIYMLSNGKLNCSTLAQHVFQLTKHCRSY